MSSTVQIVVDLDDGAVTAARIARFKGHDGLCVRLRLFEVATALRALADDLDRLVAATRPAAHGDSP